MKSLQAMLPTIAIHAAAAIFLFAASPTVRAEKTFGGCEVTVEGPNATTYKQFAYDPRKSHDYSGTAMTLSWAIVQEEQIHKVDDARMRLLESATIHLLNMTCTHEKGRFYFSPTPNSTAKEIPRGPGKYRFVGMGTKGMKPGDLLGGLTMNENGRMVIVQPKEPGEVVVTHNDKDLLEGTFKYTDGKNIVSGRFRFTDPYL